MTGSNRNLIGRVLAFVQGVVWFVLLIFGGWGLIFGPLGWIAALFGRRFPRLSAALLVIPSVVLTASWGLSILHGMSASNVVQGLAIVLILVVPALVAAMLIVRGARTVPAAAAT